MLFYVLSEELPEISEKCELHLILKISGHQSLRPGQGRSGLPGKKNHRSGKQNRQGSIVRDRAPSVTS